MSSVRSSPDAARQQPQGVVEQSPDEDDFDDAGEDQDSDDFASGDSDNTRPDVSVVTFITLITLEIDDSCENRFPLLGIMAAARLATGTRWTAGAGRPALAQVNS